VGNHPQSQVAVARVSGKKVDARMSCEKISYLIDKGEIEKLSGSERRKVKFHFVICKLCKNYQADSRALNRMFKRLNDDSAPTSPLADHEKERLRQAVAENS